MSEDISRQSHDSAMKWAAETFRDVALDLLGLRASRITGVGSPDLPEVTVRGHVMDFLFRLEDGTNLHLEFQSAPAVLRDFLLYDVLLFRRDGRPVRTVVVYTGAIESAPRTLDVGSVAYLSTCARWTVTSRVRSYGRGSGRGRGCRGPMPFRSCSCH